MKLSNASDMPTISLGGVVGFFLASLVVCLLCVSGPQVQAQEIDVLESTPADPDRLLVFDAEIVEVGSAYQYGVIEHRWINH